MSSSTSLATIQRRRFLIASIFLVAFFFFGIPWELAWSRSNIAQLAKLQETTVQKVDEIYGLLHLVTDSEISLSPDMDGSQPIDMASYAGGEEGLAWANHVQRSNEIYPIVVFSKTYCPYSRKAKKLLRSYDIHPPPKVIEVDMRDDSDIIKEILTRLTGYSTFPNIILRGKSLGGSDDLYALHASGLLPAMFEQAGAVERDK